jgi:hypothetical protein
MRSILALSLLMAPCGSANAATVHHAHQRHAIVRPNQGMIASDPASGFATRQLGRRYTTGRHRTMMTMNRIREIPRVTRLANANNFWTV